MCWFQWSKTAPASFTLVSLSMLASLSMLPWQHELVLYPYNHMHGYPFHVLFCNTITGELLCCRKANLKLFLNEFSSKTRFISHFLLYVFKSRVNKKFCFVISCQFFPPTLLHLRACCYGSLLLYSEPSVQSSLQICSEQIK